MSGNRHHLQVPNMNLDGPSDTRSHGSPSARSQASRPKAGRSAAGSHHGGSPGTQSQGRSRSGSTAAGGSSGQPGAQQGAGPFHAGVGFDPARDPFRVPEGLPTRIDLPPEAFLKVHHQSPFPRRAGYGTAGKSVQLQVNQFRLIQMPSFDVHQFDFAVNPEPTQPSFYKKIWHASAVQKKLRSFEHVWLHDGRKLAWSRSKLPSQGIRITVDMDQEQNRPKRGDNTFMVIVRPTGTIRLGALRAYLEGKMDWDTSVLECMNFLDHAIRQYPSERLVAIKRNFYDPRAERHELQMNTIHAVKGIHASLRLSESIHANGTGLGINVDVANTAFWKGGNFLDLFRFLLLGYRREWEQCSMLQLAELCRPVQLENPRTLEQFKGMSDAFKVLRKLHKVRFHVNHRGKVSDPKSYAVHRFVFNPDKYPEGADATTVDFELDGKKICIRDYFVRKYNLYLTNPKLPLIETTRAGYFPIECCIVDDLQRYNFKLDPNQTAKMIKFAVTRPQQRARAIMDNVAALRWDQDPVLREFGLRVDGRMQAVTGRVLQNPQVQYGNKMIDPKLSGRWDLRGVRFLQFKRPIQAWGIIVCDSACDKQTAMTFAKKFADIYKAHGGQVKNPPRFFDVGKVGSGTSDRIVKFHEECSQAFKCPLDIMFLVLKDKNGFNYERLKRTMECRLSMVSQMVNVMHVMKCQPQYCSNVALKVNTKLGGQNSRIPGGKGPSPFFNVPTMMIGVDVSHGTPGLASASMAAITMSMDRDAATYAAACQTNGLRVEILTPSNIRSVFPTYVNQWCSRFGCAPQNVFYLRDGVSEGQFAHVLEYEIEEIRRILKDVGKNDPKITVIVATKRHHIRFFPKDGDKNGNALPGTVVEREVTHPFHYDFYLCSHVALQGTSRPVHYSVILDEIGWKPDDLQRMIYQQCYQYQRSTTPVSLHPAVYYAHLASARARAHEDIEITQHDPSFLAKQRQHPLAKHDPDLMTQTSGARGMEVDPLLPLGEREHAHPANFNFIKYTMWYI